jgi:hypothetical protein
MVSRAKKGFPNVKLLALNQAVAGVSNSCRDVWLLYKQLWYVPFFWSLTWFSYWILREVFVLNAPLHQVDAVNYFGAIASITTLLLAVPRIRTKISKTCVPVGTQIGMKIKNAFFIGGVHIKKSSPMTIFSSEKKLSQNIQVKKPMQQKLQVQYQSPIKISQTEKLESPKQLKQPSSSLSTLSSTGKYSNQHPLSQEIPSECLTCANLISCDYRKNRFVESETQVQNRVACRFAAKISINRDVAS